MRAALPGKPRAKLQAVTTAEWQGERLVAYISGNAIVILDGQFKLFQTTYLDQCHALNAISIDSHTGKIAACSSEEIFVYKPYGKDEGALKWSLQMSIPLSELTSDSAVLSWGSEAELLVGSRSLKLFKTEEDGLKIWDCRLPKPVKMASFSHDASLLATTGWQDRLVKVWRRQSSGSNDTRFDFTYLPHPATVTTIEWRSPSKHEYNHKEKIVDDVLYSICADQMIRIWAATDPHALQTLQLWDEIDMRQSIQPRLPNDKVDSHHRFAFFIESQDFTAAASEFLGTRTDASEDGDHAFEHLAEVVKTNPDVCVVLDRHGNMSAWGMESVGRKARKPTDVFNIAHVEDFVLPLLANTTPEEGNIVFAAFGNATRSTALSVVAHFFDGRVACYEARVDRLFDPSPRPGRLICNALLDGHERPIHSIVRDIGGGVLASRTNDDQGIVWQQNNGEGEALLQRRSYLKSSRSICGMLVVDKDFLMTLHADSVSLWKTGDLHAQESCQCNFQTRLDLECLLLLPKSKLRPHTRYIAAMTPTMAGTVWELTIPSLSGQDLINRHSQQPSIKEHSTVGTKTYEDVASIHAVDPVGILRKQPDVFDGLARDIAISYTNAGLILTWTASMEPETRKFRWSNTSRIQTSIMSPSLVKGSAIQKVAAVDSENNRLTLWDTRNSQMEHELFYDPLESLQGLNWSSTPDRQSMLAAGFRYKVVILAQLRFDYLSSSPAWAPIREVNIKQLTSDPIADSVWLSDGSLVIGTGNQLLVYGSDTSASNEIIANLRTPVHYEHPMNLFDLVKILNSPLPVFHPQFVGQAILAGKWDLVQAIIIALQETLKYHVPGDPIDSVLSLPSERFFDTTNTARPSFQEGTSDDEELSQGVSEDMAVSLQELLAKIEIPYVTSAHQLRLANVIECVAVAARKRGSMDDNALGFHLIFNQHMLRKSQGVFQRTDMTWREFAWAFHSTSQDILVDYVSRQFHGRLLWKDARDSGMFMWLNDINGLRAQFKVVARNEYTKTDDKNPIDCSLYYIALRKKNVLLGLWRMATWNREQAGTQRLLKNNFAETRWKTAALKNAYALLGKRRFEYAAAWFLLAGNLQDAVNVCAHQMEDLQLAIAVARVYDGDDDNPVLNLLLKDKVLPQAAISGNRWQATWAFWMLGQYAMAVRALVEPLHEMIPLPHPPDPQARSFLAHDPALIVLFQQLRPKASALLKGRDKQIISPRAEWDFVIQTARTYDRMGCAWLALDLVRNWKFAPPPVQEKEVAMAMVVVDAETASRGKQSRRQSRVKSPTTTTSPREEKAKPTMFKEPEASSLLDSFGF